jgi:hypothetical protein
MKRQREKLSSAKVSMLFPLAKRAGNQSRAGCPMSARLPPYGGEHNMNL